MRTSECMLVVGLGEIGRPLMELLSERYDTVGVDIAPAEPPCQAAVMHICYPFQIADFIGTSERYIRRFNPALTIINSTVPVGTTRAIGERTHTAVVNSPIRGKHAHMLRDLRLYTKFVGATDRSAGQMAVEHFESVGLHAEVLGTPETTELAKLTETTYFGALITWAQEVERYCDAFGVDYDAVASFYKEISFFPRVKYVPGVIGGHCVMPNIKLLRDLVDSDLLRCIVMSNAMKIQREEARQARSVDSETQLTHA